MVWEFVWSLLKTLFPSRKTTNCLLSEDKNVKVDQLLPGGESTLMTPKLSRRIQPENMKFASYSTKYAETLPQTSCIKRKKYSKLNSGTCSFSRSSSESSPASSGNFVPSRSLTPIVLSTSPQYSVKRIKSPTRHMPPSHSLRGKKISLGIIHQKMESTISFTSLDRSPILTPKRYKKIHYKGPHHAKLSPYHVSKGVSGKTVKKSYRKHDELVRHSPGVCTRIMAKGKAVYKRRMIKGKDGCKRRMTKGKDGCKRRMTKGKDGCKRRMTKGTDGCKRRMARGKAVYKSRASCLLMDAFDRKYEISSDQIVPLGATMELSNLLCLAPQAGFLDPCMFANEADTGRGCYKSRASRLHMDEFDRNYATRNDQMMPRRAKMELSDSLSLVPQPVFLDPCMYGDEEDTGRNDYKSRESRLHLGAYNRNYWIRNDQIMPHEARVEISDSFCLRSGFQDPCMYNDEEDNDRDDSRLETALISDGNGADFCNLYIKFDQCSCDSSEGIRCEYTGGEYSNVEYGKKYNRLRRKAEEDETSPRKSEDGPNSENEGKSRSFHEDNFELRERDSKDEPPTKQPSWSSLKSKFFSLLAKVRERVSLIIFHKTRNESREGTKNLDLALKVSGIESVESSLSGKLLDVRSNIEQENTKAGIELPNEQSRDSKNNAELENTAPAQ